MIKDGALLLMLTVLYVTPGLLLSVRLARFALAAFAGLQVPLHVPRILFTAAALACHLLVALLQV